MAAADWQRLSAGPGAKGERWYDWARVRLFRLPQPPWEHWLLARRSLAKPDEIAFYVVFGPADTSLLTLARVAGQRWTIEACFEVAKQEVGLADYEVRSWHGWYRHITLAMLALAFLAGLRARVQRQHRPEATAAPAGGLLGPCPSAYPNSAASWPICGTRLDAPST